MTDDVTQISERQPPSTELRPGDVLRGRFVIERLLGEGGMGKVFLAVDREAEQSNPFVALKMLGDRFKEHPQSLKALRREATQSRRLNHPNIVNVYDFDRTEGHVFMVMEYMRGASLEEHLKRYPGGRRLTEVWSIIDACGQGLQYLHEHNIIHSDFKPGNVFLTEEGEIKVLDLGIARTIDETRVATGTTRFDPDALGALTPQYASCEMFEGLTPNARDDLFALGCVTYELLAGNHPYERLMAIEARASKITVKRPRGLKKRQWKALSSSLAFTRAGRLPSVQQFLEGMTPTKRQASPLPWIVATAAVAVVGAALTITQMRSADDRFVESVLEQYSDGPDRPETDERTREWLSQGHDFLDIGRRAMGLGEYERGASVLLTGPSSAFQSYRLVLTRTDDNLAKESAAQGMLQISHVFRDTASAMLERKEDPAETARTVCQGLAVNRFDAKLEEQLSALNKRIPKGVGSVADCRQLINTGKVTL